MRILYVLNDTFHKGGTESVVFNYFNHIDKKRYQIDFMIHTTYQEAEKNDICIKLRERGIKVYCVTPRRMSIKKNRGDIIKVLTENQYDIIHSHADCANAVILNIAKKCGIRVRIAHCHNTNTPILINSVKSIFHYLYLEYYCRYKVRSVATHYMACSKAAATWMFGKNNIRENKVLILKNAIDLEKYKDNNEVRAKMKSSLGLKNEFIIGHVGRFSEQKNHVFMLKILKNIVAIDKNIKMIFVGDGENIKKIKDLSSKMGLKNYIIFYGNTNKVENILQVMDVFILPSKYEGLPVCLIEAQANGKRCIVNDSQKVSPEVCVTPLVIRIPLDNVDEWVNQILECKNSFHYKDYSEELKMAGYDIKQEAYKLEKYYDSLMN